MVMETDTSDYMLAAILSVYNTERALHPITFHSCTFTGLELNYDVLDKELSAIFEAFKQWRHYMEGSAKPIDYCHQPQEPGILLHDKTAHTMPSTMVVRG